MNKRTTIPAQRHPLLDPYEAHVVESGLDWLLNVTDLIDGYEYGVDSEAVHTRFCVMLSSPTKGHCFGVGPTLTEAANNALDVLGGECECYGDYFEPPEPVESF